MAKIFQDKHDFETWKMAIRCKYNFLPDWFANASDQQLRQKHQKYLRDEFYEE